MNDDQKAQHIADAFKTLADGVTKPIDPAQQALAAQSRAEILEKEYHHALINREIATALVGKPLAPHAASQLIKLWHDQFEVVDTFEEPIVMAKDGRSTEVAVGQMLDSPEYAHYLYSTKSKNHTTSPETIITREGFEEPTKQFGVTLPRDKPIDHIRPALATLNEGCYSQSLREIAIRLPFASAEQDVLDHAAEAIDSAVHDLEQHIAENPGYPSPDFPKAPEPRPALPDCPLLKELQDLEDRQRWLEKEANAALIHQAIKEIRRLRERSRQVEDAARDLEFHAHIALRELHEENYE